MAYRKRRMRKPRSLAGKYKKTKKKFANFVGKVTYKAVKKKKGKRLAKKVARKKARQVYRRN